MAVAISNFVWQQGEDLVIQLVYKEGPLGAAQAVDLTNYQVRMDVVDALGPIFTFNSNDIPVIENDPDVDDEGASDNEATLNSDGTINIVVPRSLTLPGGAVYNRLQANNSLFSYDIFLRNPDNRQWPILRGQIMVEKSYTLWR